MSNKFLTPQIVANEALMVLENNLVAADLVHKDYSKEFAHVGDTITIRKPAKFSAKNFVGETVDQNVNEGSVKVTLDHFRDVTVPVTSKEMTLDIKSFSEQIISPAVQAISQAIDSDIIAEGIANAGNTVSGTANATDLKDIANIAKAFDLKGVPIQQRRLLVNPTHKYRYLTTENLSKVAYAATPTLCVRRSSALFMVLTPICRRMPPIPSRQLRVLRPLQRSPAPPARLRSHSRMSLRRPAPLKRATALSSTAIFTDLPPMQLPQAARSPRSR